MTSIQEQMRTDLCLAPGVYDALSARMAQQAGFETVYLSGASVAYTRLGGPDIGLLGLTEVADVLRYISEQTDVNVIVDADTGFGNAINVMRTVRLLEREGANAIQLEDQGFPKRCGHLKGKSLVSKAEMVGKLKAALDARRSENTLIIGRTDAIAVGGIDDAIERAVAYQEAGADIVFVEGYRGQEHVDRIMHALHGKVPLMANMVEGGDTPIDSAQTLKEKGYSLVIFPGGLVRALTFAMQGYFASLKQTGTTDSWRDRMLDFTQLNDALQTPAVLELGQRYEP
ncbi:carboxyvinyl-carboxyphosphonate phosphorylmutase [Orrella marina]|uniref:Carboxyvinyl-carboxyphosphonate phosphorylmutase n=2 Tax=Orrella marina TaxID=2163011 RepID=A0A2R4XMT9_9BURK|nr:carboxyvinyl-carboxyphosphonate phosphorylmutase [Orrella marina]